MRFLDLQAGAVSGSIRDKAFSASFEQSRTLLRRLGGLFVFLACLFGVQANASAQGGNLTLNPKRIVLEKGQRTAELTLSNRGEERVTYRLSLVHYQMNEAGEIVESEEKLPKAPFADRLLRFAPRRVVIGPGDSQRVRVLVRKPADLEHGEYRSHLLFKALPKTVRRKAPNTKSQSLSFKFHIVSAIAIPVIVRHGDLSSKVSLSNLEMLDHDPNDEAESPRLSMRINRSGNKSTYGTVRVMWVSPDGRRRTEVGLVKGIGVYTSVEHRSQVIQLRPPEDVSLDEGRLEVIYHRPGDEDGRPLAKETLSLP